MTKDRLEFVSTRLSNGITVHTKQMDIPFVLACLYVPIGFAHCTGGVTPGMAHFLEHIAYKRSRLYPDLLQFQKMVEMKGGQFGAATGVMNTRFELGTSTDVFSQCFKGLVSQAFEPIIIQGDIAFEVGPINSERKETSRWFPGEDELQHHRATRWKHRVPVSLRQTIGNFQDLKSMTVEGLSALQMGYLDPRAYLIAVGDFDRSVVLDELSRFKTARHNFEARCEPTRWARREYHEKKYDDTKRYEYYLGGIVPDSNHRTKSGVKFIGDLLTNTVQGALMEWLRNELGWCYSTEFDFYPSSCNDGYDWKLFLPLNNRKQVARVRKELHERIVTAITDQEFVNSEVDRKKHAGVFDNQTAIQILETAAEDLDATGRIYTEADNLQMLERCRDTSFLMQMYEKYWSPGVTGEFLVVPK